MDASQILLAIVQGLFEWWPVSSSGVYILIAKLMGYGVKSSYITVLSLHLASGLAVTTLLYRKAYRLTIDFLKLKWDPFLKGYVISILTSFIIGGLLYIAYLSISELYGSIALLILGLGLLVTTIILFLKHGEGVKSEISIRDWIIVGVLQGLAVLPGFSRSGLTMGYLCLMGYKPDLCVEASFLLAIPALLAAGIYNALKIPGSAVNNWIVMFIIVYIIGILSAKALLELARSIRFYYFTLILGILAVLGALIQLVI